MNRIRRVYFRIDAGYVWGQGMDKAAYVRFAAEVVALLAGLKFSPKPGRRLPGASTTMLRGPERLYCHPMDLSGELFPESIPVVEAAIKVATTFRLRAVDTYEDFIVYTPTDVDATVQAAMPEIRRAVFDALRPTRKTKWHRTQTAAFEEVGAFIEKRFSPLRHSDAWDLFLDAILRVRDTLVREGYVLMSTMDGTPTGSPQYRAKTATELRKARLPPVDRVPSRADALRSAIVTAELETVCDGWNRRRYPAESVHARIDLAGVTMFVDGVATGAFTFAVALRYLHAGRAMRQTARPYWTPIHEE